MYTIQKNIRFLSALALLFLSSFVSAAEFITITTPAPAATVSGQPLSITGTSSQPNMRVRLLVDTTEIASVTTDGGGNWSSSSATVVEGGHTITAQLITSSFEVLAAATHSFTATNAEYIIITAPMGLVPEVDNPFVVAGGASLPSTSVELWLNGVLTKTITTDAFGDWSTTLNLLVNGSNTVLVRLMVLGSPVATDTVTFTAAAQIIFPSSVNSMRIVTGTIPIVPSSSGSGPGYTYLFVSAGTITVTFTPVFSAAPTVLLSAQRTDSSGMITPGSANVLNSSMTIRYSPNSGSVTGFIYFMAIVLT